MAKLAIILNGTSSSGKTSIAVEIQRGKIRIESEGFKFVDAAFDGVPLEIRFLGQVFFEEIIRGKPWRGYKFLKEEILSDPHGFLQYWKDRIRPWFRDHPDVVALWEQWMVEYTDRQREIAIPGVPWF